MNLFIYKKINHLYCVYVFHTQYDHGAQFHLKYNHDVHQEFKKSIFEYLDVIFLLHILLGTYAPYFIIDTSTHFWKMVCVDKITISLFPFCCQYLFVFDLIILSYSALTNSSPALLTFPSDVMLYFGVKGSYTYFTT